MPEKQHQKKGGFMNEEIYNELEDELEEEYDFSQLKGGVRGKYFQQYQEGTNLVLLEPDVAKAFPSDDSVNNALRLLIDLAKFQINSEKD